MKKLIFSLIGLLFLASNAYAEPEGFFITNNTSDRICFVFASPTAVSQWGEDILDMQDCLAVGESAGIIFDSTAVPMWDLLVQDSAGNKEVYTGINIMDIEQVVIQGNGKADIKKSDPKKIEGKMTEEKKPAADAMK